MNRSIEPAEMDELFAPASIAIVGASENTSSWGGRVVHRLRSLGYDGQILPVNPRVDSVQGLTCYPSITALPTVPAHVAIGLSAEHALSVFDECQALGVPAATMFAAGFSELGTPEGAALSERLGSLVARRGPTRLIGPNCGGWLNLATRCVVSGTATVDDMPLPRDGDIALVSSSGGVAFVSMMWRAARAGLPVRYVVSTGNEADLGLAEVIAGMVTHPAVRTILVYAEQISDGPTFIRAAERAFECGKTIAIAKVGRTRAGQQAAASHTGALASDDRVWDGLFHQLGVIRVDDVTDLCDIAVARVGGRTPRSRRAVSLAISGGHLAVFADAAAAAGMEFPDLDPASVEQLNAQIPSFGQVHNPLDLTAAGNAPDAVRAALDVVGKDKAADIVVPLMTHAPAQMLDDAAALARATDKYVAMLWTGGSYGDARQPADYVSAGVPCFDSSARLTRAVSALLWADGTARTATGLSTDARPADPGTELAPALAAMSEGQLGPALAAFGLNAPQQHEVISLDEAIEASQKIPGPVALKLVSQKIVHKARLGAVALGLSGDDQVAAAFARIAEVADEHGEPVRVLVQQMAPDGVELALGLAQDPGLGTTLMIGAGGIYMEAVQDVTFWSPAVRTIDPEAIASRLRCQGIFGAAMGDRTVAREQLLTLIERWTAFGRALGPRFEYVDVNPVLLSPDLPDPLVLDNAFRLA